MSDPKIKREKKSTADKLDQNVLLNILLFIIYSYEQVYGEGDGGEGEWERVTKWTAFIIGGISI